MKPCCPSPDRCAVIPPELETRVGEPAGEKRSFDAENYTAGFAKLNLLLFYDRNAQDLFLDPETDHGFDGGPQQCQSPD
ncbi:MAG: hypothetical protein HGA74_14585 [Deltaproteobacteria bacterium]|nr:hypothetical protein [Deltaproteobacteria bacterium]NTV58489.1 hypothetical protein [Deltaproteobacteria bacterium]